MVEKWERVTIRKCLSNWRRELGFSRIRHTFCANFHAYLAYYYCSRLSQTSYSWCCSAFSGTSTTPSCSPWLAWSLPVRPWLRISCPECQWRRVSRSPKLPAVPIQYPKYPSSALPLSAKLYLIHIRTRLHKQSMVEEVEVVKVAPGTGTGDGRHLFNDVRSNRRLIRI